MTTPDLPGGGIVVADAELLRAAAAVRGGGVVAFPTETFYGLAVDPFNCIALDRLFQLKNRPRDKPVLVLIDEPDSLGRLVRETPERYRKLIDRFWPGPLTLVFAGTGKLPSLLTDRLNTVGIRLSSHPAARRLAAAAGGAITGTSANPSGFPAAVSASQVKEMFPAGIDYIIDGGRVPGGSGSTIVGLDGGGVKLIRAGAIPYEDILAGLAAD
ncbi:MAG: L-threonylcarbamoyladenylate synthase [Desulfurivibrionaceae bacterium]|nr:L-threonylcarbamoyladenylate synthase [Desulfurivibrionaceae bacterium]